MQQFLHEQWEEWTLRVKAPRPLSFTVCFYLSLSHLLFFGAIFILVRVQMFRNGCAWTGETPVRVESLRNSSNVCDLGVVMIYITNAVLSQCALQSIFGMIVTVVFRKVVVVVWLLMAGAAAVVLLIASIVMMAMHFPYEAYLVTLIGAMLTAASAVNGKYQVKDIPTVVVDANISPTTSTPMVSLI